MKRMTNSKIATAINHKQDQSKLKVDNNNKKQHYIAFIKQQQDIERKKAKKQNEKKQQSIKKKKVEHLRHQLSRKKKQLVQLQNEERSSPQKQKISFQLAEQQQKQNQNKKIQQFMNEKANKVISDVRYVEAKKRLQRQNQQKRVKQKQAQFRRKVNQQFQLQQRKKALQYRQIYTQKHQKQEIKQTFYNYKQNLGRSAYNVNYTISSTIKQPQIYVQHLQPRSNAITQAQTHTNNFRAKSQMNQKLDEENQKIIQERARKALLKMKRQKQLQEYQRQVFKKNIQYNLNRVEAGKKNQYIGIKPATKFQIQQNKQIRSEQQFQKMFFPSNNSSHLNRKANSYDVIAGRKINRITQLDKKSCKRQQNITVNQRNFLNTSKTSMIGQVSDGKYSFESNYNQSKTQQDQYGMLNQQNSQIKMPKNNEQCKRQGQDIYQLTPQIVKQYKKHKNMSKKRQKISLDYPINTIEPISESLSQKAENYTKINNHLSNICDNRNFQKSDFTESQQSYV